MTEFVIVTTQRSGSTWLVSVLDRHPEIACFEEPFLQNAKGILQYGDRRLEKWNRWRRERGYGRLAGLAAMPRYLDLLLAPDDAGAKRVRGFKIMYNQMADLPAVLVLLALRRPRIIHLRRGNVFETVASLERLRQSGQAHYRERPEQRAYEIRIDGLKRRLWTREVLTAVASRMLRLVGSDYLDLTYEELREGPAAFERAIRFLGPSPASLDIGSDLVKVSSGDYRQEVANFDEVRKALIGTRFAKYIREAENLAEAKSA